MKDRTASVDVLMLFGDQESLGSRNRGSEVDGIIVAVMNFQRIRDGLDLMRIDRASSLWSCLYKIYSYKLLRQEQIRRMGTCKIVGGDGCFVDDSLAPHVTSWHLRLHLHHTSS